MRGQDSRLGRKTEGENARTAAGGALIQDVFAAAGDAAVLLITHRPEGLELADELLELSNGAIRRL